ncbi:hypothetical protein J3E69DRAFT_121572 [Trichoderma sp. SZMC 28015]
MDGWIGWQMDGWERMSNGSNFDGRVCMYGICVWVYTSPFVFFGGLVLGYPRDFVSKFQAVLYLVVYNALALPVVYIS